MATIECLTAGVISLGPWTALCQTPAVATTTTLDVSNRGSTGDRFLDLFATVMAGNTPITGGRVTFSLNGKPLREIQVVGANPAGARKTGTAELCIRVASGVYTVSASYSGSSLWNDSASTNHSVEVPKLDRASLILMSTTASNVYSYDINSRDSLIGVNGTASLMDLTSNKALADVPFSSESSIPSLSQSDLALGYTPTALLATDISGNGTEDIVVARTLPNVVGIYMQQSDGSRKLTQSIPVGDRPIAILAEDFNDDGLIDLAVLNSGDGTVSIILQDPVNPGLFLSDPSPVHVGLMPVAMVTGDFNHDGLPDLAVANFADNTLSILVNQAALPGKLTALTPINTGNGPSAIAVASFMGDDRSDLAVTNYYDGTISVYTGDPTGLVLFSAMKNVNPVGVGPVSIVAADLNGDGLVDLVVCNSLDGTVSILPASASNPGMFPVQWLEYGFSQPISATIQDTIADGAPPNIVVSDGASGNLTLLRNDGTGRFPTNTIFNLGANLLGTDWLYSNASGTFGLAALDDSLNAVHIVERHWGFEEEFPKINPLDLTIAHQLQANLVAISLTASPLASNIMNVPATPKIAQSISFNRLPPLTYGVKPITLTAASTSGLPVSFVVRAGNGKIDGNVLTVLSAGIIVVQAEQAGSSIFDAAPAVLQTVVVQKASLIIAPDPAARWFGESNPAFTGHVAGLVLGDSPNVWYHSDADGNTPPGIYSRFPLGVSGSIGDSKTESNYFIESSVGTLTVCALSDSDVATHPRPAALKVTGADNRGPSTGCTAATGSGYPSPVVPINHPRPQPLPFTPMPIQSIPPAPIHSPAVPVSSPPVPSPDGPKPVVPVVPPVITTQPPTGTTDSPGFGNPPSGAKPQPLPIVPIPIPPIATAPATPPEPVSNVPAPAPPSTSIEPLLSRVGNLSIPIPMPMRSSVAKKQQLDESISLLIDDRNPQMYGWITVAVLLNCPGMAIHRHRVTIIEGSSIVADLSVASGHWSRAWVRYERDQSVSLKARVDGDRSCASATSEPVKYEHPSTVTMANLESIGMSNELLDLIPVPTLDQTTVREFSGDADFPEEQHESPMEHSDDEP
jgi:hypothetical protein